MEQLKINVPEGCTANIKKEDGFLIVTFEQKGKEGKEKEKSEEWEPKDGDVIAFGERGLGIFKEYGIAGHTDYVVLLDGGLYFNETGWTKDNLRPATESDKQRLFDALAKEGKRWNAEKKCIEDLPRWREKKFGVYCFISSELEVENDIDSVSNTDSKRYNSGNYFKTREAAEKVASQIRKIFKNSKAE